ncbi:MAG: hypothetical protein ACRCX2_38300 [Paraclostridium sp.]
MSSGEEDKKYPIEKSIALFNEVQLYILTKANLKPDAVVKTGANRNYLSLHKMRIILIEAIRSVDKGGYFEIVAGQDGLVRYLQIRLFLGGNYINLEHKERYLGHADFEKALKEMGTQVHLLNSIEQQVSASQSYAKRRLLSMVFGIDEHEEFKL